MIFKQNVLFLCTHNSARSQMAEGLLNHLHGGRYQAHSAGIEPGTLHPLAVKVMAEIGIDISTHSSKHVREFYGREMDLVVTVCDHAREACPFFTGAKENRHESFPDPAGVDGSDAEKLEAFRSVRNEIRDWVKKIFPEFERGSSADIDLPGQSGPFLPQKKF
ncbi:MAG: arsenate reductase ArsC [Candidatus Aminicenantes bacterium]|nr:arsenate reductase ArsC [Candidatus Aminicenantes bacterium]